MPSPEDRVRGAAEGPLLGLLEQIAEHASGGRGSPFRPPYKPGRPGGTSPPPPSGAEFPPNPIQAHMTGRELEPRGDQPVPPAGSPPEPDLLPPPSFPTRIPPLPPIRDPVAQPLPPGTPPLQSAINPPPPLLPPVGPYPPAGNPGVPSTPWSPHPFVGPPAPAPRDTDEEAFMGGGGRSPVTKNSRLRRLSQGASQLSGGNNGR